MKTLSILQRLFLFVILLQTHQNKKNRILCNNMTKSKNKNREKGLYQQTYEHDACGVGMVVNIHGNKSHELVDNALKVLENMEHRGAETRDKTGDGAGIMVLKPVDVRLQQSLLDLLKFGFTDNCFNPFHTFYLFN